MLSTVAFASRDVGGSFSAQALSAHFPKQASWRSARDPSLSGSRDCRSFLGPTLSLPAPPRFERQNRYAVRCDACPSFRTPQVCGANRRDQSRIQGTVTPCDARCWIDRDRRIARFEREDALGPSSQTLAKTERNDQTWRGLESHLSNGPNSCSSRRGNRIKEGLH